MIAPTSSCREVSVWCVLDPEDLIVNGQNGGGSGDYEVLRIITLVFPCVSYINLPFNSAVAFFL